MRRLFPYIFCLPFSLTFGILYALLFSRCALMEGDWFAKGEDAAGFFIWAVILGTFLGFGAWTSYFINDQIVKASTLFSIGTFLTTLEIYYVNSWKEVGVELNKSIYLIPLSFPLFLIFAGVAILISVIIGKS